MKLPGILHCYAEGRPGKWMAICLDFDIAVDGTDFSAVYQSLTDAINEYCEYVATLPMEDQRRLLSRRVPWRMRTRLVLRVIRGLFQVKNNAGRAKARAEFTLPAADCVA